LITPEKLISESSLKDKLWWDREILKERNLRVNILRLKNSLKPIWIDEWIHNKRWEGYLLKKC
jgi:DNA-binding response OmpR family regulator